MVHGTTNETGVTSLELYTSDYNCGGAAFLAVPVPTGAASTVRWSFRIRAGQGIFYLLLVSSV
jgi:hypothetical protein